MSTQQDKIRLIRETAENDLLAFIRLVSPNSVLGAVHEELITWITSRDRKSHKLVLLPRDHQKSRIAAFWAAWQLTKNPHYRILYISSTSNLAEKQLKFIKDILDSKVYRTFWPEMINERETDREKWTNCEISVDHPRRTAENVRDPSVFTAGLTSSITGLHCDIAVLDDVVVFENANTEEGREKVKAQVSLLTSIEGTDSQQLVVGTRYHPADVYNHMMDMEYPVYDKEGEEIEVVKVYDIFERKVEENGEFLWPRQQRPDGRWFGFDQNILSRKKAQYLDKTQFYAQYYNNPNNPEAAINRSKFQYYDRKLIERKGNTWWYNNERINVFAAIDFAFSLSKKADYTALVVVGVDRNNNIFVLDVIRFKTQSIKGYYDEILKAYQRWGFRKIRCEITSAQSVIVKDLKDNYIRPNGLMLAIDEHNPSRHEGSKEERVRALIEPRYDNQQVWHYKGGNCEVLEDELLLERPPHDDCKDALAAAIDICVAPKVSYDSNFSNSNRGHLSMINSRFGGVRF